MAAPGELWALRYPGQHVLHILNRPAGAGLHVRSATSSVHAPALADVASVVIASEELDGEAGWWMLEPGELVYPTVEGDLALPATVAEELAWTRACDAVRTLRGRLPGGRPASARAVAVLVAATAGK